MVTIGANERQRKNCEILQRHSRRKPCNEIHHSLSHQQRPININSIPWMFTEQQSNVVKEVMQKIKFPTRFCANLKNIITKKR